MPHLRGRTIRPVPDRMSRVCSNSCLHCRGRPHTRDEALWPPGFARHGRASGLPGCDECDRQRGRPGTCGRWLNNRAENSHQPFRRREGAMAKFRDVKTLRKFAAVHPSIHNHSHGKWLVKGRINSLCTWPFSAVIGSKSEPLSTTRPFPEPVKLTSGRRSHRLHQHPAFGGGGSGGRDHSSTRLFQPNGCPVRPPGSGEADQAPRNRISDIAKG